MFLATAFGQGTRSNLEVTVKDPNGLAVPGAQIKLTIGGQVLRNVNTTNDGIVKLDALSRGLYKIEVSSSGFASALREIEIADGESKTVEVTLSIGEFAESVSVTAERRQISSEETPVPVSVVDREQIERKAVNTIGDIFRSLPGTSSANEGAFQVRPRIRGLDSNRVLVLVDGERLNNSRTSTGQSGVELGLVETSQVESVEVVRGSGSVLYGTDALGGTINIITRDTPVRRDRGFRFGGSLDTFYSSNENGRRGSLSVTGAGRYFAFRVGQSLDRFGNYRTGKPKGTFLSDLTALGASVTADGEVQNSQSHSGNTHATVRAFINDTNTFRANYERRRGANIGSAGLLGTFTGFFPFSDRDKVSGRYDSAALNKYLQRLSISGFHQTQLRNFTNVLTVPPAPPYFPGIYQYNETVTDTGTLGFDLQSDWQFGSRNNLIAGVSLFRDTNQDRRSTRQSSTPTSTTVTTTTTKSVPDASLANVAAFAQNEFRVTSRFKLVGGFRFDNFKTAAEPTVGFALPNLRADQIADLGIGNLATGLNVSKNAVTGDFGAVYRLTGNVSLSGRIGRSFRAPNIFELFFTDTGSIAGFVVGNPRLKPETGTNIDTSLKFKTSRFAASVTYFNNSYKNLLATVAANDSRNCPVFIVRPGTVYDSQNCSIVTSPPGPAPVRVYQTQNVERARIQGVEFEFEAPIKISLGYLTPNGNISYLRGDNTERGVPLDFISPLRTNVGVRWNNYGKSYFFDYTMRIVAEQSRLSPSFLLPLNQGGNGGPEAGFTTHNISGGYYFRRERYDFNVNVGVSNLANRAYSEQFVFAPARGRSFTIGTTWTIK